MLLYLDLVNEEWWKDWPISEWGLSPICSSSHSSLQMSCLWAPSCKSVTETQILQGLLVRWQRSLFSKVFVSDGSRHVLRVTELWNVELRLWNVMSWISLISEGWKLILPPCQFFPPWVSCCSLHPYLVPPGLNHWKNRLGHHTLKIKG